MNIALKVMEKVIKRTTGFDLNDHRQIYIER